MFEIPAAMLSWFFGLTQSYIIAIALMSVVVMAITTPLTIKSTKGMLEMQKLSPEMRRLQNEHRNDKQKLNEEMMTLYKEHKVNPMSSCLPIVAQMPVFIVMFRVLRGLTYRPSDHPEVAPLANAVSEATGNTNEFVGFIPRYLARDSSIFVDLYRDLEIPELGLDLSLSPFQAIQDNPLTGIVYALLVVALGGLYFGQQRMVAARASISPSMSPTQQKVMQYLPVVFAVFQIFFLTALVVYYIFQTLLRILQQYYITKKFYGTDESLGRQAQRAGEAARESAKESGESPGLFAQAKRDLMSGKDTDDASAKTSKPAAKKPNARPTSESKRVTAPKSRPTKSNNTDAPSGKGRPTPTRKETQAAKSRPVKSKSSGRPQGGKNNGGKKKR
ncbi:MAG: YidC/Oxa1 family membrane protein insertase [Ilumatobacter sp.]|jgi:YidC/Oxa1 family membrane protein insertase